MPNKGLAAWNPWASASGINQVGDGWATPSGDAVMNFCTWRSESLKERNLKSLLIPWSSLALTVEGPERQERDSSNHSDAPLNLAQLHAASMQTWNCPAEESCVLTNPHMWSSSSCGSWWMISVSVLLFTPSCKAFGKWGRNEQKGKEEEKWACELESRKLGVKSTVQHGTGWAMQWLLTQNIGFYCRPWERNHRAHFSSIFFLIQCNYFFTTNGSSVLMALTSGE